MSHCNGGTGCLTTDGAVFEIPAAQRADVATRIVSRLLSWGDGCWIISRTVRPKGYYGSVTVDRRSCPAHRVAYALVYGPIPAGMEVCHDCDTPACVRPAHLFLGTHADNMRDRRAKGRYSIGAANPNARLTEEKVLIVWRLKAEGLSHSRIAKTVGAAREAVRDILSGRTWRHVRQAPRTEAA